MKRLFANLKLGRAESSIKAVILKKSQEDIDL